MHALQSHQNPVSFVAWSPDDTKLLTCGNAEVAKLWDVESGACEHTFGDRDFVVGSCAWFPDSKRLVCGSSHSEKGIYMWACDGTEIKAWRGPRMPKILDLAVTSDGENLISVLSEKEILVLNVVTNAERLIVEEHPITSLSLSADSKFFIVNLNSQEIHLWDVVGDMKKPLRYSGHRQRKYVIRSCFGGLNSGFIASGSEDSRVWFFFCQSILIFCDWMLQEGNAHFFPIWLMRPARTHLLSAIFWVRYDIEFCNTAPLGGIWLFLLYCASVLALCKICGLINADKNWTIDSRL